MRRICLLALFGVVWLCPSAALADDEPAQAAQAPAVRQSPDFLFSQPRGTLSLRGGWLFRNARSDWFDFVTDQLTIDRRDFRAAEVVADVGLGVTRRLDLVFGVDWSGRSIDSEYRDFVDNNRQPIDQTTRFRQASLTAGVRYALLDRGRSIGTLAWLPNRIVPYVGGGGGVLWYQMLQQGDFVDVADFSVFRDVFESKGWRPVVYGNGGVDVHIYRPLYLTFDARYQWADADLGAAFIGFEPLDLSGLRISTGVNIVF